MCGGAEWEDVDSLRDGVWLWTSSATMGGEGRVVENAAEFFFCGFCQFV